MQRHSLDPTSLIFGLAFAAAGSLLLVGRVDVLAHANWLVPVLLILVALAMLASAAWSTWRPGRLSDEHRGASGNPPATSRDTAGEGDRVPAEEAT